MTSVASRSNGTHHCCPLCVCTELVNKLHHMLSLALVCLVFPHGIFHLFFFQLNKCVKISAVVCGNDEDSNQYRKYLACPSVAQKDTFPRRWWNDKRTCQFLILKLNCISANFIQKTSVVRYDNDSVGVLLQVCFQPQHGFQIQVIRS
jgi:hypothetical protein